ncbi:MAG TPA: LamG-like jellyroll fold domain-containing protein [Lentimicrobium sp.]|nr:LamG-like jellyroll fold domain-containing protein [Bacteroidales bacterium]HLO92403.1 LamG-like jellyroll fold domain-containing protein [Lentimicrobium sp.]
MKYITFVFSIALSLSVEAQKPVFKLLFDGNGADSSGNNFAGGIQGSATYSSTYRVQGNYSYSVPEYSNWESNSAYTITNRTFSISANIRRHYEYTGSHILFSNRENTGSSGFDIRWDEDNSRLYGRFSDGVTPNDFYSSNSILISDTWYHIVIISTSTGYIRVYLNNVKLTLSDSAVGTTWTNNKILSIGSGSDGHSAFWMTGYIDNFQYYNYVLSSSQVDSLYDNRASSFQLGEATAPVIPNRAGVIYYEDYYVVLDTISNPNPDPDPEEPTDVLLSTDFSAWSTSDFSSVDALMAKWPLVYYNNVEANQEIVNVGGTHGNVFKSTIHTGETRNFETYISLGGSYEALKISFDYYIDPAFNGDGIGGGHSGKMFFGAAGSDFLNIDETDTYDTTSIHGMGGKAYLYVWGSGGLEAKPGPYQRDQLKNYFLCGPCGFVMIPKGEWHRITTYIRVNDPGYTNGFLETALDGEIVSLMPDLRSRSAVQGKDFGKLEWFIFDYFFGGSGSYYAAKGNYYIMTDNIVVERASVRSPIGIGGSMPATLLTSSEIVPENLLKDESFTSSAGIIYDMGQKDIYFPVFKKGIVTKTVTRPVGQQIKYKFDEEEFGFPDWGTDCESYCKVYSGTGSTKTLLNSFGRTGVNNGTDKGYENPSGWYTIPNNTATFEMYTGCNSGDSKGIAVRYTSGTNICFVGNSIMVPVYNKFVSDGEQYDMTNLAFSGHTATQQLSAWNALSPVTKQSFDYVLVEVGVNDVAIGENYLSNYQALITQINTDVKASCKIIAATMTPCRQTVDYTRWQTLNAAIRGEGANAITGIDVVMTDNTTDLDLNHDGYLDAFVNSGDGVHPSPTGTAIIKRNFINVLK